MTTEEILLSRAVDRAASVEDWRELQELSARDTTVWQRLAETLHAETALARAVDNVFEQLPAEPRTLPRPRSSRRLWLQGLAAAVLVLGTWVVARSTADDPPQAPIQGQGMEERSAKDLLREYVRRTTETGRHVRELPLTTLATRRLEGGGLEVIYLRRLLERSRVDRAVRLGRDEHGRLQAVPASLAAFRPGNNF